VLLLAPVIIRLLFYDPPSPYISILSLHDALPISLLAHPGRLIATFAHELAHYLLATAPTSPPCEDDEHEFLTDLTAAYLGFGVRSEEPRLNSSHSQISYAVFCLKKKNNTYHNHLT